MKFVVAIILLLKVINVVENKFPHEGKVSSTSFNHSTESKVPTPIVLWHGIGDTCCSPGTTGGFKNFLEEKIPGVYVLSIRLGKDEEEDLMNSYFKFLPDQVSEVCSMVSADPHLQNGYHAVGFSQGGLLMRAAVQTCTNPPVLSLVTFGGPQQGVYGYPSCPTADRKECEVLRRLAGIFVYRLDLVQRAYVPFQYWHDPLREDLYKTGSLFLADVNNVRDVKQIYKDNLTRLRIFVMVVFKRDIVVVPLQSAAFGFFSPGQSQLVLNLNQTQLYKEDRLGLKEMQEIGKLRFFEIDAPHMIIDYVWVKDNVLQYLL